MKLRDFFQMNDSINNHDQMTAHTFCSCTYGTGSRYPMTYKEFTKFLNWQVVSFKVDETGHWHVLLDN